MSSKKVVLITGAASGIGLAAARRMAKEGFMVGLLDRSESVRDVAAQLKASGASAFEIVADLADIASLRQACETLDEIAGGCDVLVNNAGVHPKKNGRVILDEEMSLDDWEAVFRINTTAPFLLSQHVLPRMKERKWGRIINVTSRAGRTFSDRAGTHYSASKAAVIGMTRAMAGKHAMFGITINAVAPGQIETPLARTSDPKVLENAARTTPAGRLGTTDEVASAIQYLASEDAAFITGAVIDANGGSFMG